MKNLNIWDLRYQAWKPKQQQMNKLTSEDVQSGVYTTVRTPVESLLWFECRGRVLEQIRREISE